MMKALKLLTLSSLPFCCLEITRSNFAPFQNVMFSTAQVDPADPP